MDFTHVTHESIPPFINEESKILILGSLPSVKSREDGFFYAHKQNRFFKTIALVFAEEEPKSILERKQFLNKHHVALYDVIYECDICGSSDATIKNVKPIKLKELLKQYPNISKIYTTGKKAKDLYDKYLFNDARIPAIGLPSTSAANARMDQDKLTEEYKVILEAF